MAHPGNITELLGWVGVYGVRRSSKCPLPQPLPEWRVLLRSRKVPLPLHLIRDFDNISKKKRYVFEDTLIFGGLKTTDVAQLFSELFGHSASL